MIAGGRTADEIVSWLLKKSGLVAKDLTSVDEAKGFIDASNVAIIGFFKVIFVSVNIYTQDNTLGLPITCDVRSECWNLFSNCGLCSRKSSERTANGRLMILKLIQLCGMCYTISSFMNRYHVTQNLRY
jgi:hypothetical protein